MESKLPDLERQIPYLEQQIPDLEPQLPDLEYELPLPDLENLDDDNGGNRNFHQRAKYFNSNEFNRKYVRIMYDCCTSLHWSRHCNILINR